MHLDLQNVITLSKDLNEPQWLQDHRSEAFGALEYFISEDKTNKLKKYFESINIQRQVKKINQEITGAGFLSISELLDGNKAEFYREIFLSRINEAYRNPYAAFISSFFSECNFYFIDDGERANVKNEITDGIAMNFFIVGNNSEFLLEHTIKGNAMEINEVCTGENSKITTFINQIDSKPTSSLLHANVVGENSIINSYCSWFGSGNGDILNKLTGEKAEGYDVEVFVEKENNDLRLNSTLEHSQKHTKGNILVKGIVKDVARVRLDGMIKVDKTASGSNSFLDEHVILLNEGAHAEANPELEIENNDISSRHSASVSQIDENKLFYIQSRGINNENAKRLIVEGFLNSAIQKVENETIKNHILKATDDALS